VFCSRSPFLRSELVREPIHSDRFTSRSVLLPKDIPSDRYTSRSVVVPSAILSERFRPRDSSECFPLRDSSESFHPRDSSECSSSGETRRAPHSRRFRGVSSPPAPGRSYLRTTFRPESTFGLPSVRSDFRPKRCPSGARCHQCSG
jgi:hypothetical protein